MHKEKKTYLITDGHPPKISEVLNDCNNLLCFPTRKGETLASILVKMCNKIESCCTASTPDIVSLTEGVGIDITGSYPNFTITNSEPDQVVTLSEGSNVTITGTYPNFTIAASGGGLGTDELVKVSLNDTTGGYLNGKLVQGAGLLFTENNDGGNETFTLEHADTSSFAGLDTSGAQVVDIVTVDGFGHVTNITTRNLTTTDIGAEVPLTFSNGVTRTGNAVRHGGPMTSNLSLTGGATWAYNLTNLRAFDMTVDDGTVSNYGLRFDPAMGQSWWTQNNSTTAEAGFSVINGSSSDINPQVNLFAARTIPNAFIKDVNITATGSWMRLDPRYIKISTNPALGGVLEIDNLPTGVITDDILIITSGNQVKRVGSSIISGYTTHTITNVDSPYTVTETTGKVIILADTTGGNITINLPTAIGNTAKYTFKKINSNSNIMTVDAFGGQTIDGVLTADVLDQNDGFTIINNNANWFITSIILVDSN